MESEKFGFKHLVRTAFTVLSAALGTLSHAKGEVHIGQPLLDDDKDLSFEKYHKNVAKPKLILKLNLANPDNSLMLMHTSHSSHRSHSSHSSHSSHYSSSYSSGRSYTPSPAPAPAVPVYAPSSGSNSSGSNSPKKNSQSTPNTLYSSPKSSSGPLNVNTQPQIPASAIVDSTHLKLGERVILRGCEGTDVEELQRLLTIVKKDITITGYYGNQTEAIVIQFQNSNELKPNGIVDKKTLEALKNKKNGISLNR